MMSDQPIQIEPEDIHELCRINPIAAAQLEAISLRRMMGAMKEELDASKNGHPRVYPEVVPTE